jgi:restriction endonuclease S subunit
MSMPLPPLDEQQNIARFLDEQTKKIDDLIEAKRDLLALLKEKRKSVITHAVKRGLNSDVTLKPSGVEWLGDVPEHWRIVLLRRLISEMRNGTSTNQDVESEHSVPVTRIETISNGFINFAKVGYVEYDKALEPYRLQRGDILMSHINSLQMIGNCAFYDSDKVLFNGMNVLRIQPQSNVHSEWLWQTLASNLYRQAIRSIAKPAINQASVTTTQIKQLQIPLPPHDEQRAIAQFLREHTTKIDVVINEASAAITQLTDYRTALISAAVTGKIDLRGGAA